MLIHAHKSMAPLRALAALVMFGAALAGCTSSSTYDALAYDQDYKKRHPILIADDPEVLDLPVGMKARTLSPGMQSAIRLFLADYKRNGRGALNIQVPSGSANEVAAVKVGHAVRQVAQRDGVPPSHIRISPYSIQAMNNVAPVRVSFMKTKAVVPQCGLWPEDLGRQNTDRQYYNFGCANQQNVAAMVENPGDFIHPRQMTPADGVQRSAIIDDYRGSTGQSADSGGSENSFVLISAQ